MERSRHVEYRAAVLDCGHAPGGEAFTIAQRIDEVHDRSVEIARQDEVAVHGMRDAFLLDSALRCNECLCEHLATEHAPRADVAVMATVDVDLDCFEVE